MKLVYECFGKKIVKYDHIDWKTLAFEVKKTLWKYTNPNSEIVLAYLNQ